MTDAVKREARIYLSPPHLTGDEGQSVQRVLDSNWIAPFGPEVRAFESEFAELVGVDHALAVSSGTAALHLALRLAGVKQGDHVLCSTLTFIASANPIVYLGGIPVFIDSEPDSWNIDPDLVEAELEERVKRGKLPQAIVVVDVFGQSADYDRLLSICDRYEVTVVEDAAEALGATYKGRSVGSLGRFGAFSFNANKIISTSQGGMLVSNDPTPIEAASFLASQAKEPAAHYQHSTAGYNYTMSSILAAVGRAQLKVLSDRIESRRNNFIRYRKQLGHLPGIGFMPEVSYGRSTRWLTCIVVDPQLAGITGEEIRKALDLADIESRPIWKPLHLQPVFEHCPRRGGRISEGIFEHGLCLPSGSNLTLQDIDRVCQRICGVWKGAVGLTMNP